MLSERNETSGPWKASGPLSHIASVFLRIAEMLRSDFKSSEYQDVILPFVFLIRLQNSGVEYIQESGPSEKAAEEKSAPVHTSSLFDMFRHAVEKPSAEEFLASCVSRLSDDQWNLFVSARFDEAILRLEKAGLLGAVFSALSEASEAIKALDSPSVGRLYEMLLGRFAEYEGETAGEHYTPRGVVELMSRLLLGPEHEISKMPTRIYDPACGVGGMLQIAVDTFSSRGIPNILVAGQELNDKTFSLARLIWDSLGNSSARILPGNTLTADGFKNESFEFMIANPPFGVDWRKIEGPIKDEAKKLGFAGRFGAGLPRVSDGSLLFLQHLISKMRPRDLGGSRIAIVFSASPLFSGVAGSGESNIRLWILENDLLEGVIALPDSIFLNTTVSTYVWILSNKKPSDMAHRIRLVNGTRLSSRLRRNIGTCKNEILSTHISQVLDSYWSQSDTEIAKSICVEDCVSFRVPVRVLHRDGQTEKDAVRVQWPRGRRLSEIERGKLLGAEWVSKLLNEYLTAEFAPFVLEFKPDLDQVKLSCEVPFGEVFFRPNSLSTESEVLPRLLELSQMIKNLKVAR